MRDYHSEADKVRDMPQVMKYIKGKIADLGCGNDKIVPEAIGFDARNLPGVDHVCEFADWPIPDEDGTFDTVFSSHLLEHLPNDYDAIQGWWYLLKPNGHLVLYLPDGRHYNNNDNPEHMRDYTYESFMLFFRRCFCGEGKDYKGDHLYKFFELVDSGLDVGDNRYSFYVISRKI